MNSSDKNNNHSSNWYLKMIQFFFAVIFVFTLVGVRPDVQVLAEISSSAPEVGTRSGIPTRPTFTCADTVRIMPLGDSITYDNNSGETRPSNMRTGYRSHLWWVLQNNHYKVNFVGSQVAGEAVTPPFDPDNEGHPGWRDDEIAANVYNWLNSTPADIILLHIGTNSLDTSATDVENILNEIDRWEAYNSQHITVILARIINRQYGGHTATTTFNNNVAAMAAARTNDDIIIVDMENGAGINYATDMHDNLHPNDSGYQKMAAVWYQALTNLLPDCSDTFTCPTNMTTFFPLEESSQPFLDTVGGLQIDCSNCPVSDSGKVGNALKFSSPNRADIPADPIFDWQKDGSFTIEFWLWKDSIDSSIQVAVGREGTGSANHIHIWIGVWGNKANFTMVEGSTYHHLQSTNNLTGSQWQHIVAVRDGQAKTNTIYLNGQVNSLTNIEFSKDFISATDPMHIGWFSRDAFYYLDGKLDQIVFYDRPLSTAEVQSHYANPSLLASCVNPLPSIYSTPVTIAQTGQPYSYEVKATGNPQPTYSLVQSPNGMSIDPVTGVILWTPLKPGSHEVTVKAENINGFDTQAFSIMVSVPPVCPVDMTSYWELDETTTGLYADSVGSNDAACLGSNCPAPAPGIQNGGQVFSRSLKTKVNVPADSSFNWGKDDSFTIEYWMKGIPGTTCKGNQIPNNEVIVGRQGTGAHGTNIHIWTGCSAFNSDGVDGGYASWQLRDQNYGGQWISGTTNIADGNWHHIVAIRDKSTNKNFIYVDGVKEGEVSHTYTAGFSSATEPLNIGWLNLSDGFHYSGEVDEVALYNRALSPAEINEHYNNGIGKKYCNFEPFTPFITSSPVLEALQYQLYTYQVEAVGNPTPSFSLDLAPPGMTIEPQTGLISWTPASPGIYEVIVRAANTEGFDTQAFSIVVSLAPACPLDMTAYWKLDETLPGTYQDFVGTNNAVCTGSQCPTPTTGGIVNGAQVFSRALQNKVNVPRANAFEWGVNDSFTIEYWMKGIPGTTCKGSSVGDNEVIVGRDDSSTQLHIWTGCQAYNSGGVDGGRAAWQLRDINGNGPFASGTTNIADGAWHHIVVTRDAALNKNFVYVDGVKEGEASHTYTAGFTSATAPMNIGWLNLSGGYYYSGTVDEIALYNRALSPAEIETHYNSGLGRTYCPYPPSDILLSNNVVEEAEPAGTEVGDLSTVDLDVGDTHTYTLVSGVGSGDNTLFSISGDKLLTAIELTPGIKTIRVRSSDSFGLYLEKVFEITVGEKEKAPFEVFLPLIIR